MLHQPYEVRAFLKHATRIKEQEGIVISTGQDEREARAAFAEAKAAIEGGKTRFDASDWLMITLTGPNGAFDRATAAQTAEQTK